MVEPGLTSRLKQHSRRSGMLIGLSMAIAIAICIVAFIWIYIRVGPFFSDFVPSGNEPPASSGLAAASGTPTATVTTGATPTTAVPTPTPTPSPTPAWMATHRIAAGSAVNFRAGPNTISQVLQTLAPGTELKFLGEEQLSGGFTWMHMQAEDGTEGWIRTVDLAPLTP